MTIKKDTITFFSDKKGHPPLRCSCGILNLVIRADGLVKHPGKVIEVVITAINEWPSPVIDPATSKPRYQFDYVIEYDDELLVDPERNIRGCDIEISCCETCTSKFLKGELKSVWTEFAKTPKYYEGRLGQNFAPEGGLDISAAGFYDLIDLTIPISNSHPENTLEGMFFIDSTVFIDPIKADAVLTIQHSFVESTTSDQWFDVYYRKVTHDQSDTFIRHATLTLFETLATSVPPLPSPQLLVPPGQTRNFRFRSRIHSTGAGTAGSKVTRAFCGLRFLGIAGA